MKRAGAIGIQSTPTILINGISVPFEQLEKAPLKQLIEAEIARVTGTGDDKAEEVIKDSDEK
jgi:hypothetical protein